MNQVVQFFSTDIGRVFGEILRVIYSIISPSNAGGAYDVPLPEPGKPLH